MMVTETERVSATWVLAVQSSPATRNLGTGSMVKVPGPVVEKSYAVDTVKRVSSTEVVTVTSSSKLAVVFCNHSPASRDDHRATRLGEVIREN